MSAPSKSWPSKGSAEGAGGTLLPGGSGGDGTSVLVDWTTPYIYVVVVDTTPKKIGVSNWTGFSSEGFWLIQKKDNWVLGCFSENTMATVMAILQSSFDQVSV